MIERTIFKIDMILAIQRRSNSSTLTQSYWLNVSYPWRTSGEESKGFINYAGNIMAVNIFRKYSGNLIQVYLMICK
jgi:hypothetical protein